MTNNLKITTIICISTCLINLATPTFFASAHADSTDPFLTSVSENLTDLTHATDISDLHEDVSDLTESITDFALLDVNPDISTAAVKIWAGTLWAKTWLWTQIRK